VSTLSGALVSADGAVSALPPSFREGRSADELTALAGRLQALVDQVSAAAAVAWDEEAAAAAAAWVAGQPARIAA